VISSLHRQHRTIEFEKFLAKIDATVPADLHVHLIADNYGTHKTPAIKPARRPPRFTLHHTPTYSSWLNLVVRWFAYLIEDLLQRSDHRSVQPSKPTSEPGCRPGTTTPDRSWGPSRRGHPRRLGRLLNRINGAGHQATTRSRTSSLPTSTVNASTRSCAQQAKDGLPETSE
jgi:transposase